MRGGERDPNDADQCRHCEGRGEQTGRPRALHMPPPSHRPINRSSNRQALSGAQLERAVMSRVRTFFRTDGWRFRWIENEPDGPVQLCMGVSGRTMENQQLAVSFEHGSLVLNFPQILFVDRNSDAQVSRVCKGLMHLNRRLLLGSFGLDLRDGEVSFRLSQVVHDGELTDNQLSQMVYMGVRTVDEQMNSLMQLADSSDAVEPRDVIDGVQLEALEGSSESEIEERIAGTDLGVLVRACVEGEEEAMALKNANAERERRDGPGGGRDHEGGPGAGGRWRDHGGDAGGDGGSGGAAAAS
uniref:YbjN domain-containing protein n=1 Tax=Chromera velia CCMP2878 TaxID=1169474 RepID=A0A0G4GAG1_9ALVE|eukprot:Cvel_20995.t1-p1 / transcript=Cvel_20995.t1 / gene=Cvel_20995 / organism=Chromera_velia_CCMP2878 / gene_product=hypothetical protein / transcript_product=hypothetical protein / location=Cvel_scaffold1933:16156-18927(-) / protein_length=298 / sequence_SO=supercontig / SO=protein_coding / is_pseudo=false